MGSVSEPSVSISAAQGLGHRSMLDKIDKLRELVGTIIPLPQLVVVGDQSSGKSSVLESLTGFCFPRASGLCTRYATQITCRREPHSSVTVGIIPRPDADDSLKTKLRAFRRSADMIKGTGLGEIFEEANLAMGIRSIDDTSNVENGLLTFSEDILKIEINGPDQPALTIIDVPGIFRTPTPGLTTDEDIGLVTSMVKSYMKDPRTIILAVIPCNIDIATQEILKLAKEADPSGSRTMGVLTKPDLVLERAMKQNIVDLIQGKRQDLKLGYCVVKNRGADDENSTLQKRNAEELAFFRQEPWSAMASTKRVGTEALKTRLRDLLSTISKKEFPALKIDTAKRLADCSKKLEGMGATRSDEKAQRAYLGKLAANFERIVGYSLNAYYTEDPIFTERLDMRLITRVIELNEVFSEVFSKRGHTRRFDLDHKASAEPIPDKLLSKLGFELPEAPVELAEIIVMDRFQCPEPTNDSIMDRIKKDFRESRGPELGTFGGSLLGMTFKEQSIHWEDIVLSHISDAIVLVHRFILDLLDHVFADEQVKTELYNNVLLEKLQEAYTRTMIHARFLLQIEREGKPITFNKAFNTELQKRQTSRLQKVLDSMNINESKVGQFLSFEAILSGFNMDKSNPEQVCESIHDILQSYYNTSAKRFVDAVCQQVIDHFLLNGKSSPLHVFSTDLVLDIDAGLLEVIAGEDDLTKQERERLTREIESLQAAIKVLRGP
ncbi:hypothetical protein N0V93_007132 [Gnomoniopsis smithogilvyi]|uniref:Uncharacterized protein n=1 Tax=Gnomoniopsis smithogilvyi TaxID=1191159 RepID=A0A9W9CWB3_9PEZI|nr:hypothetical protein N0V93_007132 [Gnomoniopsis smithogilvyi]